MTTVERVYCDIQDKRIDVVETSDGVFELFLFSKKFDVEENVSYEIRVYPNPAGKFGDLSTAIDEAKRLIRLGCG
tara:strand:+ start:1858 stop:2082 length:225 start_codon:yes stop_codon:yes gene_type:complete